MHHTNHFIFTAPKLHQTLFLLTTAPSASQKPTGLPKPHSEPWCYLALPALSAHISTNRQHLCQVSACPPALYLLSLPHCRLEQSLAAIRAFISSICKYFLNFFSPLLKNLKTRSQRTTGIFMNQICLWLFLIKNAINGLSCQHQD